VSVPPRIYAADVQSPPDTSDFYYRALSTLETKIHFKINYSSIAGARAHVHTGFFSVREDNGSRDELLLIDYTHRRGDAATRVGSFDSREEARPARPKSPRARGTIDTYRDVINVHEDRLLSAANTWSGTIGSQHDADSARPDSARLGSARLGSARLGSVRCGAMRGPTRRGAAQRRSCRRLARN